MHRSNGEIDKLTTNIQSNISSKYFFIRKLTLKRKSKMLVKQNSTQIERVCVWMKLRLRYARVSACVFMYVCACVCMWVWMFDCECLWWLGMCVYVCGGVHVCGGLPNARRNILVRAHTHSCACTRLRVHASAAS